MKTPKVQGPKGNVPFNRKSQNTNPPHPDATLFSAIYIGAPGENIGTPCDQSLDALDKSHSQVFPTSGTFTKGNQ